MENNEKYITEITGGPKKFHRKKLKRNPNYQPPKPVKELVPQWIQELGQDLRRARMERGFTQAGLAKALRSYQPVISSIENGRANPTAKFLNKYCEAIGKKITFTVE